MSRHRAGTELDQLPRLEILLEPRHQLRRHAGRCADTSSQPAVCTEAPAYARPLAPRLRLAAAGWTKSSGPRNGPHEGILQVAGSKALCNAFPNYSQRSKPPDQ